MRFYSQLAAALAMSVFATVNADEDARRPPPEKQFICHGTASPGNPYVLIEVSVNGAGANTLAGHLNNPQHNDPTKPKRADLLIGDAIPGKTGCFVNDLCQECCSGLCIGDPHFKTWAGQWYDFHGQCDLVFLSNPTFSDGLGLDIHIRTTIRGDFSFIESAAVKLGSDILEVSGWGEYLINGVDSADMTQGLGGFPIKYEMENKKKHNFVIEYAHGKQIQVSTIKDLVTVQMANATQSAFSPSVGLMGDFTTGELLGRDGSDFGAKFDAFGLEWQVRDTEASLFNAERFPQYPAACVMPGPVKETSRRLGESILRESATKACAHWGDAMELCVNDVMSMGDLEVAGAF